MKFLVDMPLSPQLARWLVDHGHDAVHASAVGLDRADDVVIIEHARRARSTIVTADLDYPRLLALAAASEPSLILFRGGQWGELEIINRMQQVLAATNAADLERCILVVDRDRVRRRKLPITRST